MSGLHVTRVELSIKLIVPISLLQKQLPAPIDKLGEQLADEVHKSVVADDLGYYPALDYFKDRDGFPAYLLDAVDEVFSLASTLASQKIVEVLVPIFSNVRINNIQCSAYTLPGVRPGKPNAKSILAKHYTPNTLKYELIVSVLQKHPPQEGFEKYADNTVYRWLSEIFESVEIASARLLKNSD